MRYRLFRWMPFVVALGIGACGDCDVDDVCPAPKTPAFTSLQQIAPTYVLTFHGGGGQWDILLTGEMHNLTDTTRLLTLRASCPIALLVYNNSSATGVPSWDSRMQAGGCSSSTTTDSILPRDSLAVLGPHTNTNEILIHYGLGPANMSGAYYFFALFPTSLAPGGADTTFVGYTLLQAGIAGNRISRLPSR